MVDGQPLRVGPVACEALVLVLLAPPAACVCVACDGTRQS